MQNWSGNKERFPTELPNSEEPFVVGRVMDELLDLLNRDERSRLAEVERRLDDPEALASMIQKALREALRRNPAQMEAAFRPLIITSLNRQDGEGNSMMKDAVTPVVGSATGTAVKQAFNDRMVSLSQTLSRTFSLDGLKWRVESLRTGQPFAEIALRNSAVYEICDVYLIDRSSGLLMLRVGGENSIESNPDAAAGMLTAIQDFARDSAFAGDDTELSQITLSDHTIYLEDGSRAYLAAVVRGNAPLTEIRPHFRKVLETYHKDHAKELREFARDSHALVDQTGPLESCLLSRGNVATLNRKHPVAKRYWIAAWLLLLLPLLLLLGWWLTQSKQEAIRKSFVETLQQRPGAMVSNHAIKNDVLYISGMRNESFVEPSAAEIDAADLKDVVYSWYEPDPVDLDQQKLREMQAVLAPPDTVKLQVRKVVATGSASDEWLATWEEKMRGTPSSEAIDTSNLVTPLRQATKVKSLLPPSPQVEFQVRDGEVHITGEAPGHWIAQARQTLNAHPFVFPNHLNVQASVPPPPPKPVVKAPPPPPIPPPPVFPLESFRTYIALLKEEPGIIIQRVQKTGERAEIVGALDKFSVDPDQLREQAGLDANWLKETWTEVASDHPEIVNRRIAHILQAVPTLSFSLTDDNRVILQGTADEHVLMEVRQILYDLPEIDLINSELVRRTP